MADGHPAGRRARRRSANVVILGGGVVGHNAAKIAHGPGCERDHHRPQPESSAPSWMTIYMGALITLASNSWTIKESVRQADLVIGAVLIPGASAPRLVRRDMIAQMKARFGGGGRCYRPGRVLRNLPRHHAHRSGLLRRQRAALLRSNMPAAVAAHVDLRAYKRHFPLLDAARVEGRRSGHPFESRHGAGREYLQREMRLQGCGRLAGHRVHRSRRAAVEAAAELKTRLS